MAQPRFTLFNFALRWGFALILVFGTFNPTSYSYIDWVFPWDGELIPLKALVGVTLIILYIIYLRATYRSIGPIGVGLAALFLAAFIWVLIDAEILALSQTGILTWIGLFAIATIMGIGLSWSHIRRRLSGQADVDEVDT